jgi:hypothetical protein
MNPQQLLDEADRLLASSAKDTRGLWPRACAWLIRLALEQTLDEYWARELPEAGACSMRAQLLLLPRYAGVEAAAQARDAWFGLARAAHHHSYDLAPTAGELRRWHDLVLSLSAGLTAVGLPADADAQ